MYRVHCIKVEHRWGRIVPRYDCTPPTHRDDDKNKETRCLYITIVYIILYVIFRHPKTGLDETVVYI